MRTLCGGGPIIGRVNDDICLGDSAIGITGEAGLIDCQIRAVGAHPAVLVADRDSAFAPGRHIEILKDEVEPGNVHIVVDGDLRIASMGSNRALARRDDTPFDFDKAALRAHGLDHQLIGAPIVVAKEIRIGEVDLRAACAGSQDLVAFVIAKREVEICLAGIDVAIDVHKAAPDQDRACIQANRSRLPRHIVYIGC